MPSKFIDLNLIQRYDAVVNEKINVAATALDESKQDSLVSGTNIKTVNNQSILGSGNIDLVGVDTIPVGTILQYSGLIAPSGYLLCDGSAVSRTTYSELYNEIGTTYGTGDGSTTFNLPNLKGRVPVGFDTSDSDFDTLGGTGGEKEHTLTINEMPSHDHSTGGSYLNNGSGGTTATWLSWGSGTAKVQATGGGQAHNNLQPYIVTNYIIKATTKTPTQAEVLNTYSTSTEDAYSASYANSNFVNAPTVLYNNTSGTYNGITLNESVVNYSAIEIYFHTNDGAGFRGCQKVHVSSGTSIASLQYIHTVSGNYYIKVRQINIVGNQITNYHSKEIYSGGMSDNNTILIDKVLGYK